MLEVLDEIKNLSIYLLDKKNNQKKNKRENKNFGILTML